MLVVVENELKCSMPPILTACGGRIDAGSCFSLSLAIEVGIDSRFKEPHVVNEMLR